jgi:hypothetical protein
MDPLLFLGSEFLKKMTDPTAGEEDRESLRYEFATYFAEEDEGSVSLVNAFNRLDFDELSTFARETALWYLDWVTRDRHELAGHVEPRALGVLWSAFNEPVVRARAVEAVVVVEEVREVRPARSEVINIIRLALGLQLEQSVEETDRLPTPEEIAVGGQVVDTLLTEQSPHSLRILGEAMARIPLPYRQHFQAEIDDRLANLGEVRAQQVRAIIYEDRRE